MPSQRHGGYVNNHLNPGLIARYATTTAAALFVVVAGSGIAMFFHIGESLVKEMHEWLAVLFVVAAAFHIYKNRTGLLHYFKRRTIWAPLGIAFIAAAAFIVPASLSRHVSPVPRLLRVIENARLVDLSQLLNVPEATIEAELKKKGFIIPSPDQKLAEISAASDKPVFTAIMTILEAAPQ